MITFVSVQPLSAQDMQAVQACIGKATGEPVREELARLFPGDERKVEAVMMRLAALAAVLQNPTFQERLAAVGIDDEPLGRFAFAAAGEAILYWREDGNGFSPEQFADDVIQRRAAAAH